MTDRPLVIVNPKAGRGSDRHDLETFQEIVRRRIPDADFALTERPRHATELAATAAREGRKLVVATGGDGSIHEVACGLMQAKDEGASATELGIIGRGTGGDLCKTLGLEHRLDRYLDAIVNGVGKPIDVGKLSYVDNDGASQSGFFINILSAGMGGLVDRYVHDTAKWAGGKAGYFLASARALLNSSPAVVKMTLVDPDGERKEVETTSRMIAICNGRYFGSGMKVAPMAEPNDGIFEIIDMGASSKLGFGLRSGAIYKGEHLKQKEVQSHRATRVDLEVVNESARSTFLLDVDGEPLGSPPISVEVLPKALTVRLESSPTGGP